MEGCWCIDPLLWKSNSKKTFVSTSLKKNQHQRFVIVIVQVLWPSEGELEVFGETFHFLNSVKVLEVKIRSVLNGWLLNQDKDPNTH